MAGNLSNFAEDALLDHLLGTSAYTMPTNVRLALYTSDPTDADTGAEVTTVGTAYVRQPVAFDAAVGGTTQNDAEIVFPVATDDYGTVTHVGIKDATTGGNLLMHGPLDSPKLIETGDQFRMSAGELAAALS